jgi:hypothetical protein
MKTLKVGDGPDEVWFRVRADAADCKNTSHRTTEKWAILDSNGRVYCVETGHPFRPA